MDTNTKAAETKAVKEAKPKTKGGAKMDKIDYSNHKVWGSVVTEMALAKGVKVAQEYGKAILKLGKVKAPWENPYHCFKMTSADNKEQLLKVVAILGIKKDNPTGNTHVLDNVLGKIKGNFAKDGLKDEKAILTAAKKYVKNEK